VPEQIAAEAAETPAGETAAEGEAPSEG